MNHSEVKCDISKNTYIAVEDDQHRGIFRWLSGFPEPEVLPSSHTLKDAPSGWVEKAEKYLEEEGFNVLGR